MESINFEIYFAENENMYCESKTIISILEDIMNMGISDLKEYVSNLKVSITADEIKSYLDQKFTQENPELKKRIEEYKSRDFVSDDNVMTVQDIKDVAQDFTDRLIAKKYEFESYTLTYFNKYTSIVKNKANSLLNIIEKIGTKDTTLIDDELMDLDIGLDENGNILKADIIRLIEPTIYNVEVLKEKVDQANNLETYLSFKMSLDAIYRNDLSEEEVYPHESIQPKSLIDDYRKGNVRLSENQREKLEEASRKSRKIAVKALLD